MPIKPTEKPRKLTRKRYITLASGNVIEGTPIEFYAPLMVRCPNGEKHKAYIRDNEYGAETYLGTIKLKLDGKKQEVEIPGWVKPNKHQKKTYDFIPYQDHPYAYVLYPAKERLV